MGVPTGHRAALPFRIPRPYETSYSPGTTTLRPFAAESCAAFSSPCESILSGFPSQSASEQSSALSTPGPQHSQLQCTCLQQHVQLIYQLQDLHSGSPAVDDVVRGVQAAQPVWEGLMQCNQCRSDRDGNGRKHVFLLFATSISTLLSSVSRLGLSSGLDADRHGSSHPIGTPLDVGVWVGSFELGGEIKAEVLKVVLHIALNSIKPAVLYLWDHSGRPAASMLSSSFGLESLSPAYKRSPLHSGWGSQSQGKVSCEAILSLLDTLQSISQAIKEDSRSGPNAIRV